MIGKRQLKKSLKQRHPKAGKILTIGLTGRQPPKKHPLQTHLGVNGQQLLLVQSSLMQIPIPGLGLPLVATHHTGIQRLSEPQIRGQPCQQQSDLLLY